MIVVIVLVYLFFWSILNAMCLIVLLYITYVDVFPFIPEPAEPINLS